MIPSSGIKAPVENRDHRGDDKNDKGRRRKGRSRSRTHGD